MQSDPYPFVMGYRLNLWKEKFRREIHRVTKIICGHANRGYCPICEKQTLFVELGAYLRNTYICYRCGSIPRWRTLYYVLSQEFPNWKQLKIHESSPGCVLSDKLARECESYLPTQFIPNVSLGTTAQGFRIEDLSHQTFADGVFDLVVTADVFEHLPEPEEAFKEIERTLKPGGAHIFTVPWNHKAATTVRARLAQGKWIHFAPPEYHMNPVDPAGSLVTTDWGYELPYLIQTWTGMATAIHKIKNRSLGIDAEMNEVFVSRKILPHSGFSSPKR